MSGFIVQNNSGHGCPIFANGQFSAAGPSGSLSVHYLTNFAFTMAKELYNQVNWKVEGMTCANCALNINRLLEKKGMQNILVNAASGDVHFEMAEPHPPVDELAQAVEKLGYKVREEEAHDPGHHGHDHGNEGQGMNKKLLQFLITLPFTLLLMTHMIPGLHIHWLMNPWVQFALALPVYVIGMNYFGRSAWNSIKGGIPNMDVLIALGATAAFGYSVYGLFTSRPEDFMFFETAASILTIVFFGNWLEDVSIERTQRSLRKLLKKEKVTAHMIAYDNEGHEQVFPVDSTALKNGDLILVKTGEQVPADGRILSGEAEVSEALLSGESVPVLRKQGDQVVGGSLIVNGTLKAYVTATGKETVMSSIVDMMKRAQSQRPPVQKLADKISSIFIPFVLIVALITFLGNYFIGSHTLGTSLLRSIAVLVVACPCAMGLATPAAIAVGLGRAAKHGILFTDSKRMELFRTIKQMVFDKTGTLTTGKFSIRAFDAGPMTEEEFKKLVFSIEKYSAHPIAKSIAAAWRNKNSIRLHEVEEIKGEGMRAKDDQGNVYRLGSQKILAQDPAHPHNLYLTKNGELIGWMDIVDEYRPEAKELMDYCRRKGIKTILLSGDTEEKCRMVAADLGMDEYFAERTPAQKLELIEKWDNEAPVAMVGDGINDAPALAKATISISLSEASQLAIQSAGVVLTQGGLKNLPKAMQLGKLTYRTVQTNLAWAFLYNIVAIPVAAFGYLHPTFGALLMGASDVVLAINSLWLGVRKLD